MIIGMQGIVDDLEKMSDVDLVKAASDSIRIVQGQAKLLCPVNHGELRNSIYTDVESGQGYVRATCYTNKDYAPHVEFGTGPKGQEHHEGASPDSVGSYTQSPWWIHESQVPQEDAERYHWFYIDTPDGRFYRCSGQPAQPYMYPALKNNEEKIIGIFRNAVKE